MVNDEERREVAKKLWSIHCETFGGKALVDKTEVADALGLDSDDDWYTYNSIARLADLIDRPACKNASSYEDVFKCSECHCDVEIVSEVCNEHGKPLYVSFTPSYCPNCGAEAVAE